MTISTIRNRIDEINNRINERTNELTEEQNPYIEMDPEIIALNSELTSLNNEMGIARNEVYAYAVNYRKNNLENDLQDANNRYNARGEELSENDVDFTSQFMDSEYNAISNEINSIQGEIDGLNGYIENYSQTRFGSLEKQLEEANANLEARMNTLEEEGNNYPQMDEEVINLSGQISMLNDSIQKMKEEIKENAYYLRIEELKQDLANANKKIEEKEIELDNNNVSYDDRYMDQDYINVCRERDYIQKQIDDLKYKYDNNLLTDEIFNQINLPELPKKTNDKSPIESSNNPSSDDSTNKKDSSKSDANTDTKNLEDQIEELERKLNENARRLEDSFRKNDKEAEKIARKERKELLEELMSLKKQKSGNMNYTSSGSESGSSKDENNSGNGSDSTDSNDDSNNGNSDGDSSGDSNSDENDNNNENDNDNENDLDPEEPDNEITDEEKKQKIKKAAIGALGGAIGFGLSFALQPGTAGTVISVGRLVYSTAKKGLKVYTEKHKDDENNKIIKMVGKVKEFTKEQAEKYPKITSAVVKVNNFLKKPETQIFLNGMAAGYTIGKISQAVYKMHEASAMEKNKQIEKSDIGDKNLDDKNIGDITKDNIDGTPAPNPTPTPVVTDPTPTFDPTKPVDLSSLGEGYVSSYSSDPVSLITSAGKNAMFDKINVVDGKTWVHFTQGNGAGYAWFPADEVLNALDLSDISELTGEVSGGMHL